MKLKIMGSLWKVVLQTRSQFDAHGDDFTHAAAMTDPNTKTLYFPQDGVTLINIRHELFHAYWAETLVNDLSLDLHQAEECGAAIVGAHCESIVRQARRILKWLRGPANDTLTQQLLDGTIKI